MSERKKGLPGLQPLRESLGLNQVELAAKAGVHYFTVLYLESGRRDASQEMIHKLCDVLECTPNDLMLTAAVEL